MEQVLIPIGIGAVVVLVLVVAIWSAVREYRRCRDLGMLAMRLGFRYTRRDSNIPYQFVVFDLMNKGENRYGYNVMAGKHEEQPVTVFDYHYQVTSGSGKDRHTEHYYHNVYVMQQERDFPELRIYPENIFSKIGQFLGYEDIDFESSEFSKAFTVRGPDKKFAYDICHVKMMEYLLEHRKLHVEINCKWVALIFTGVMTPEEVEGRLKQLVEIRRLFPQYLYAS